MNEYNYEVGDIVKLKKPHPCGSHEWEILRTGADFRLNRSKTMNHNLFEFNTVVRARYNNNVLTKGLIKDMEENNVIVKLFGNDDERFSYAFETVEFKEGYFESQVESFLYDVCTLNVKNL